MTDRRKKFAAQGLTHSAAHHLVAVGEAIARRGYARVSDIARQLEITRGSVSVAMQSLKSAGYVKQDENHFFHLTDEGNKAVAGISARHKVVERFLAEVLGLSEEQSHRESCRMENLLEAATTRRLHALLEFWRKNDLSGALEEQLGPECPICGWEESELCPFCGLECLEDVCSMAKVDEE